MARVLRGQQLQQPQGSGHSCGNLQHYSHWDFRLADEFDHVPTGCRAIKRIPSESLEALLILERLYVSSFSGRENCFSEAQRGRSGYAAEDAGEVALIGEAAFSGNVGEGPLRIP